MKYEASGNFINILCSKTISLVRLSKRVWPLKMTIIGSKGAIVSKADHN
jgi:hypothetical protein